ncbi:hypothetical protein V5O48_011294 [Marasmius crinis-equi]|uniref:TEA domain-containing protein n=1 Tax=Marasmius crinis-equi TaxID=585013 RepID=A0ABR3F617_9AGAR
MQTFLSTQPGLQGSSYTPNVQQSTKIATEQLLKNRKTWKTLKANKECVWSPDTEAALIEGLEKYRPASQTDPLTLKRFPKRNRWISEHIMRVTGKLRSPKQVGSRLQQLRDTCRDERIMRLLNRRQYTPEPESPDSSDKGGPLTPLSAASSPSTPWEYSTSASRAFASSVNDVRRAGRRSDGSILNCPSPTHTSVLIELNPPLNPYQTCPRPSSSNSGRRQPSHLHDEDAAICDASPQSVSQPLSRLPIIDTGCKEVTLYSSQSLSTLASSAVSFTSPLLVSPSEFVSCFQVFLGESLVHAESTELRLESSSSRGSGPDIEYSHLYISDFIPQFWKKLGQLEADEICHYSFFQHITRKDSGRANIPGEINELLSLSYNFKMPALAPQPTLPSAPQVKQESPVMAMAFLSHPQSQGQFVDCRPEGAPPLQQADLVDDYDNLQLMYPTAEETGEEAAPPLQQFSPHTPPEGAPYPGEVVQSEVRLVHPYENAGIALPDDGQQQFHIVYADPHAIPVIRRSGSPDSLGLDAPMREHPSSIPPPEFVLPYVDVQEAYPPPLTDPRTGAVSPSYFWAHNQVQRAPDGVVSGYAPLDDTGPAPSEYDHGSGPSDLRQQDMVGPANVQYYASGDPTDAPQPPLSLPQYLPQGVWIAIPGGGYQFTARLPMYGTQASAPSYESNPSL